jgi:hypothetical protein
LRNVTTCVASGPATPFGPNCTSSWRVWHRLRRRASRRAGRARTAVSGPARLTILNRLLATFVAGASRSDSPAAVPEIDTSSVVREASTMAQVRAVRPG